MRIKMLSADKIENLFAMWKLSFLSFSGPVSKTAVVALETEQKVEVKSEVKETRKKKKKGNITWATDDKLVEYHYYEPDDEERGK